MIGMRCGQKRVRGGCVSYNCNVEGWKLEVCKQDGKNPGEN